jgi:acyl-CoA oxidase
MSVGRRGSPAPPDPPGDPSRSGRSALLSFLPLLYVAWSDGSMDLAELRSICNRAVDVWKMSPEDRERFVRWLDPDQPPTESELDEILALVRESSAGLTPEDRRSLTELGLALARVGGGELSKEERVALEEIEHALGGNASPSARKLLGDPSGLEDPQR